ncbi:hypothetical protein [Desmospora activa]|uniref:Uncharacterized protein n=1 Tax=Desmospora activa DSM 45169 TaxID=1121389 RepID=A0A2T4YZQ9_9BACL|nr:hypothetical protein [Desmospora activa]PTM52718.1 hypothetical protein C8J48_3711 [Desmospora activa DSM 45169]
MKPSWKDRWLDFRDTFIENLEEFLTTFLYHVKQSWDPGKVILGGIVVIAALVLMIANWLSGASNSAHPLPPVESEEAPDTPGDSPGESGMEGETSEDESSDEEETGLNQEDEKAIENLGTAFVEEYLTYQDRDMKDRSKRIRPYVIEDIYQAEKQAADDVPGDIPPESQVKEVTKVRVQMRQITGTETAFRVIWLGTVSSVIRDEDGKESEVEDRIELKVIPQKSEWKIAEVIYH